MENTLENKAKFFAQYYGIEVLAFHPNGDTKTITIKDLSWHSFRDNFEHSLYLQLRPLSSITDEEAIEVAKRLKLYDSDYHKAYFMREVKSYLDGGTTHCKHPYLHLLAMDYLRSRSFAIPFHDLSVEQQIAYGWVKLTNLKGE